MSQGPAPPAYDVAIVGAGPGGASCAWYLASAGIRVALIDRQSFPRDKVCGDAVCAGAQVHLARMGALQAIMAHDEGHLARVGGMVSPGGVVAIGNSTTHIESSPVIAIRRIHLDHRIVQAATAAGATLIERFNVVDAVLDGSAGLWSVRDAAGQVVRARALVAADGARSRLARRLGVVEGGADAICSRAYVETDSTAFGCDGVAFYRKELLPGYCALFRESRGQLNFCVYVIPGGDAAAQDLRTLHERLLRDDPFVSRAVGPRARIGAMKGGPLRLGGVRRSYGEHLLVIGDAAGQIDPLTGEGIQYAMDAAQIAASALAGALAAGDLSAARLKGYHTAWHQAFGADFAWSARIAKLCGRYPALLDIGASALRAGGAPLLAQWAEVMTGARPKTHFLRPRLVLPMLGAAIRHGATGGRASVPEYDLLCREAA